MVGSPVRAAGDGVLVDVVVTPNASRSEVRGVDPWRHALQVRVAAVARDGAANDELRRLLAEAAGVPPSSVRIVSGAAARRKAVSIAAADAADVARRLGLEVP